MRSILSIVASHMLSAEIATDHFKEQAIEKLNRARTLPRKQKKVLKKDALLDYSIALWNEENLIMW